MVDNHDKPDDAPKTDQPSSLTTLNLGVIGANLTFEAATIIQRDYVRANRWLVRKDGTRVLQQGYHAHKGTKMWIQWEDVPEVQE